MQSHHLWCALAVSVAPTLALAQTYTRNFDTVTSLARDAVAGANVAEAVPGFEILLMHRGEVVFNQSFGYWASGQSTHIDSASKTLSGAAIMALTDQQPGFSLDSKLSQYLPQFTDAKAEITIRDAFAHTSGLGYTSYAITDPDLTLQESASQLAAEPIYFPPGTAFVYGGVSMQAAGAAAEVASGISWNQWFQQRIAAPLGLEVTEYAKTTESNPWIGGGAVSTAPEFARFMEMLRSGGAMDGQQVLSASAVQAMFTRQTALDVDVRYTPLGASADYGVGVWLDERDAQGNLIGAMAAGARGFTSWIDFDDEMVGVFATEYTPFDNIQALQYAIRAAAAAVLDASLVQVGDANLDGQVDGADYTALADHLYTLNPGIAGGDFNQDGLANGADYTLWADAFSPLPGGALAVPEPGALSLAGMAVGTLLIARRALQRGGVSRGISSSKTGRSRRAGSS
jgi:CubicO group peptidase (beta-lactamase class C family)